MKKGLNKCLSIVLTIAMLVSVMSVAFVVNAAGDTVTINGTEYKVGDTIEVKKEITVNDKWLMNGQITVPYNNTVLEFVEEDQAVMFPVLNGHAVVWNDTGSVIKFNFTDITNGVDFTSGGIFYDFTFKVKAGSETPVTIDDNLEFISTFPFNGDPKASENKDKPVLPESVLDDAGEISADKGNEGEITVGIVEPNTLTVNDFVADVGDTIYISKKIKVNNKWLANGQIHVTYDPEYLEFVQSTNDKMFPNIYNIGLFMYNDAKDSNNNPTGEIIITFTDISKGYDFTKESVLYELPFKVKKGSYEAKSVEDNIVVMSTFACDGDPSDYEGNDKNNFISVLNEKGEIADDKGTTQDTPFVSDNPVVKDKIIVNGIEVNAGDVINHYIKIQDKNWFANIQAEVTYDNTVLEFVDDTPDIRYPVISKVTNVVENDYNNGDGTSTVLFNFTTLDGVNFDTMGRVFNFYFKVKDDAAPGNYEIKTNIIELYAFDVEGDPNGSIDMTNIVGNDGILNVDASEYVTEIKKVNLDELNNLITEAKSLAKNSGYTKESIEKLNTAITAAENVLQNPQSQEQVDNEVKALQQAIDALEIDLSALENLIKEAEDTDTTGYTEETVNAFKEALEKAKEEAENPTSIQAVADAKKALEDAKNGLVIDTSALENLIKEAEDADTTGYTEETVSAFKEALEKAKEEAENPTSVQAVADAKKALEDAKNGLVIDTSALENLIKEAEDADTTGYTEETVNAFKEAIEKAKEEAENPTSVQAVADAKKALEDAKNGLVVDTAELENIIDKANELVGETTGYIQDTIDNLKDAIKAAEAVLEKPTVDDVKAQIDALTAAINSVKPDTSALETAIAEANKKLAEDIYSPKSKAALQAAVDEGNELIENIKTKFVSYEDVVAATDKINKAIEGLVEGVLLGDANNDGKFNVDDASWIQRFLAKLVSIEDINTLAADVNKDGKITIMDATSAQIRLATNTPNEYVFSDEV